MAQQDRLGKRNTTIITENGKTFVRYHWTDVIGFDSKEIVLDSNGWKTATTKMRMNQASNQFGLGFTVTQKDFEWFVEFKGKTIAFKDGMTLKRS